MEQLRVKTPGGRIKCQNCDPEIITRIEELTGSKLVPIDLAEMLSLSMGTERLASG
jgi:hypothetical protein